MNEEAIKILSAIPMPEEPKTPEVAPKESVQEPETVSQKVTEEVQQTNSEVEETPKEVNPKKQKISELVDLKRKARALSRELGSESAKADTEVDFSETTQQEAQKAPEIDVEALREQLLAEAEARLEARFKPQLDEVEVLRNENEKFKSEQAEVKLKSLVNDEVKDFIKKYPQAELMIDKEYLVDLIRSNPKNADMTGEELIMKAYPKATQSPKMDSYGQQAKNQPKPIDFANIDDFAAEKIKKGGKAQDDFVNFLRANR